MMAQVGHLPFYLADSRVEVAAVAESRPSLIAALSERIGRDRIVADHRVLLERSDIEAVVISAPRPATGPLTLAALEAGKHVLAEKPMAHTAAQAKRLADAARVRSAVYAVGFMKRYDPGVVTAKALFADVIQTGRLGKLLLARFFDYSKAYAVAVPPHVRPAESRPERFEVWPLVPEWLPAEHAGAFQWFVNAASHDVNLVQHFFGNAVGVEYAVAPNESAVLAMLRAGEIRVVLEIAKTEAGRWLEGAEFLFEKGRIAISIPSPMATEAVTQVVLDDHARGIRAQQVPTGTGWCFARQAAGFVDALVGIAPPLTSGDDGLAEMNLTEAVWRRIANI